MVFKRIRRIKIPEATIRRLSLYDRCLDGFLKSGKKVVSSTEMASICGTNPAQIRKDFAYFGELGVRGVGYYIEKLRTDIRRTLGIDSTWNCALVGAGNLGSAFLSTDFLVQRGFRISVIFDQDPVLLETGHFHDVPLFAMGDMRKVIPDFAIRIGIIAADPDSAVKVSQQLADAGVKGILNLTPSPIKAPPGVIVRNVDFAIDLEGIAFHLNSK